MSTYEEKTGNKTSSVSMAEGAKHGYFGYFSYDKIILGQNLSNTDVSEKDIAICKMVECVRAIYLIEMQE